MNPEIEKITKLIEEIEAELKTIQDAYHGEFNLEYSDHFDNQSHTIIFHHRFELVLQWGILMVQYLQIIAQNENEFPLHPIFKTP